METDDGSKITARTITIDELPEGFTPVYAKSQEEADKMAIELFSSLVHKEPLSVGTKSTIGTAVVDIYAMGGLVDVAYINLLVDYVTSGSGNTGVITSATPRTTLTGLTAGISWNEGYIGGYITSSGKDYYAYCNGILNYVIFWEGIGTVYSESVSLSGYAYIIH